METNTMTPLGYRIQEHWIRRPTEDGRSPSGSETIPERDLRSSGVDGGPVIQEAALSFRNWTIR